MAVEFAGDAGSTDTIIGPAAVLNGSLELDHGLCVLGTLRGESLRARGRLVVEQEGQVWCRTVHVTEAVIRGQLVGSLMASRQVRITATAYFRGAVTTPLLLLEEGAHLAPESQQGETEGP